MTGRRAQICLVAAVAAAWLPPALAGDDRTALAQRAAIVVSAMRPIGRLACESRGTGLAVGGGLVLTAAHVLLDRSDVAAGCKLPAWALTQFRRRSEAPFELRVAVAGASPAAAALVNAGRRGQASGRAMTFSASADYAILRVDTLRQAALPACDGSPSPRRAVVVVLPGGVIATRVAAAQTAKTGDDADYVDLEHVFEEGTSGAGVLDAESLCVWGLISHRFPEPNPRVTRMTPIGAFAAAWRSAR